MADEKNYPRMVLYFIQLACFVLLLNAVDSQNWYSGNLELDYTEGVPTGTSMDIQLDVDKDSADGNLKIDGFFSYLDWQSTRNDTTIPSDEFNEKSEFDVKPLSDIQEDLPLMIKIAISMSSILIILSFFKVNHRSILGIVNSSLAFYILLTMVILAPIGYLGDFDFTSGMATEDKGESTVHQSFQGTPEIKIGENLELNYIFTVDGYDLGLVNTSQLETVIESEPSSDHPSYFKIEGKAGMRYSTFVTEYLWACMMIFFATPIFMSFREWTKVSKPLAL
ncbi:MAG: hypothetical protein VW862_01445 [Euryarchaeota archaeon]